MPIEIVCKTRMFKSNLEKDLETISETNIYIKNRVLGRFWADLDCRFEFYVKNYVG